MLGAGAKDQRDCSGARFGSTGWWPLSPGFDRHDGVEAEQPIGAPTSEDYPERGGDFLRGFSAGSENLKGDEIMDSFFSNISELEKDWPGLSLLVTAGLVALAVLALNLLTRLIFRLLERKYKDQADSLATDLLPVIASPVRLFFWVAGVLVVSHLASPHNLAWVDRVLSFVQAYGPLGYVLVATLLLNRVTEAAKSYAKKKRARTDGGYDNFSSIEALGVAAHGLIYLVALFCILAIVGVPLSALASLGVVGGFGAYALTMANQILISNIFAGLVLYFDRPFSVGDWISTQDGAIDGTVTKIGLRLTTVVGFDKRPISVPNSIFNTSPTINPSRMTNRRIKQFIGVRYTDLHRVEKVMQDIRDYLKGHAEIDQDMITLVNLVDGSTNMGSSTEGCFGSSSINLQVYTFTKTTNWVRFQNIQDEIMLQIGKMIEDGGAEIAFNTLTVETQDPMLVQSPSTAPASVQDSSG